MRVHFRARARASMWGLPTQPNAPGYYLRPPNACATLWAAGFVPGTPKLPAMPRIGLVKTAIGLLVRAVSVAPVAADMSLARSRAAVGWPAIAGWADLTARALLLESSSADDRF